MSRTKIFCCNVLCEFNKHDGVYSECLYHKNRKIEDVTDRALKGSNRAYVNRCKNEKCKKAVKEDN